MKTTDWRSVLSSSFPTPFISLSGHHIEGGQPLTSVSGQQSGAASRRRRFNFSLRSSALIPQRTQLRCGCNPLALRLQTPLSVRPSPVWRICAARSQPGRVCVDANRQLLGGYSVTGEEARGEEGRGRRSHSDQLPASLRRTSLTSTVNAAMQGPSGATAAVQLLLTWI